MRKYSSIDLLRFHKFASEPEQQDKSGIRLIKDYNTKFPELSAKQQILNVYAALGMNEEYKAISGHDIPQEILDDWKEE